MTRAGLSAVLVAAVALISAAPASADPLPRADHVARTLAAVRALGPDGRDALDRTLYAAARTQCHADTAAPTARCLIEAARAACAGAADRARCEAAADVIVTNLRAASTWVDERARARLVRGAADYRAALAAELHRRYAALAVELVLGDQPGGRGAASDEATAIDALCARRDREPHICKPDDAACVPSTPWSRCVAALVWFVGGGS